MEALKNPAIKAIFLNQGGDDGIRVLPYIDFDVIKNNPKIFIGFSDGSTFCNMFTRAGRGFLLRPMRNYNLVRTCKNSRLHLKVDSKNAIFK